MQQKKLLINVLVILLAVVAIIAGYFYVTGGEPEPVGLTATTVGGESGISSETSEFLILLDSLQSVDFSGQVFQNKVFATDLVNFTQDIPAQPQGRDNPFAPLGAGNRAQSVASEAEASDSNESQPAAEAGATDAGGDTFNFSGEGE